MSAIETSMGEVSLRRQIPAFAAVGALGFVVDSGLTYALVRGFAFDPMLARIPAFALATVFNFALNRSLTFAGSRAPLLRAFLRYCLVCGAGFAVNWTAYALSLWAAVELGLHVRPEALPIFVAFGTGVAMFVTFFGFKLFAFRD
ncbi:MAG: GtrA family protein [Pseudomonadota bacterium]|nr:GtrA family protein [Pseudomonadota bacterium]